MKPPNLKRRSVRNLRNMLLARKFAVPKLQRNFVWDARRAASLLDSMYHEMPIGSLFLWEMDRKSANLIRQSADVLPSFDHQHKSILFVIDGQQRLSVIHQAFEAQSRENDAGIMIDFARLCFVVNGTEENGTRIVYRKPFGRDYVSVRDILAPDWKRRMPSDAKGFLKKIADCRSRLMNYPVPVVTIPSATLDEIGEVFIRINSQGMRITSADRAIALMGKLDVRAMALELRQKARDANFAIGSIDPILMGFNLVAERPQPGGDPPKLESMARRWSKMIERDEAEKEKFRKLWHRFQNAFLSSVDYLRLRFPVLDESYLPSANMIATLAVFFFHHPAPPNRRQSGELRKWFWATGVGQRYSGRGYHRNIVADARFLEALGGGAQKPFQFPDRLDPILDVQGAEYVARSARTRAFFCLLADRRPKYLDNGEPIDLKSSVASYINRKHRHHIFPRARLKSHFSARAYNSLCNICYLVSYDNTKIGMRLPRKYLANYRAIGSQQFRQIMKSHLIPYGKDSGIWNRGIVAAFKDFRRQRLALICGEFEKKAGMKLFKRG